MKLKKGDTIKVIAGKDKGREGKIEKAYANSQVVVIPGINLYTKHIKKNDKLPQGGKVKLPRPLNIAKVMLICPHCKALTRVGYEITKAGKKVRICKKCKSKL